LNLVLDNQQDTHTNTDVNNDNTSMNSIPVLVNDQEEFPERSNETHILSLSSVFWACSLLCILLLLIGCGIPIYIHNKNLKKEINHSSSQKQKQFTEKGISLFSF